MARQAEKQEAEQEHDRMGIMGEEEKDEVEKDEDPPPSQEEEGDKGRGTQKRGEGYTILFFSN